MQNNINKDEEIMTRSKREIIMKLLTYLKPYKLKSFFVVLLMIFVMLVSNIFALKGHISFIGVKSHSNVGLHPE